jgi:hypothetical protein
MLQRFEIFVKFKLGSKLSVSENRKIASRCPIASGVYAPLLVHVGGNAESFICRRAPHFSNGSVLCLVILQFKN